MTVRLLSPSHLLGRAQAPPSKSYTHRALVVGSLTGRRFQVVNPLDSDDTRATARALRRLGSSFSRSAKSWIVGPTRPRGTTRRIDIQCGESGTTLRFASVVAALGDRATRFHGSGRLPERPMGPLLRALEVLGASVDSTGAGAMFTLRGPIRSGRVRLDASESSQFASALLLALPTLPGDSEIRLVGTIVSEPYLQATVSVLRALGVRVRCGNRSFHVPGSQSYRGRRFAVPGDASSAAYLWVAGALAGGSVTVRGVDPRWPQADRAILALLARAGAAVRETGSTATVGPGGLRPFSADLTASPDLYPLAGVLAAAIPGTSHLSGAPHIVHKESDRRAETARLARAFGARVRRTRTGLSIEGRSRLRPVELPDLTDHRLVMSAAVGALAATGSSRIGEAEAVRKSFPRFWETLVALGAECRAT
ncbi:MAG: 3-phosphoshikimate 1-carboxyvinyltransferase [Thermoplasmata archaeon]|nr:3-phosphoshikimate 1-carboxyvinyltransferase [Thermoplasmata archaeon]